MDSKVAIIGAGSVGATIAYACLIRGVSNHIVIYDINKTKVESEVLDFTGCPKGLGDSVGWG